METQERILEAARELFFKYGIKSVTMDDIAKHLSISKKTIYLFFKDKNQIVDTLTTEQLHGHQSEFEEISDASSNAIYEIMELMKCVRTMFMQMNPNLFYDMQKYHPDSWKKFKSFKEERMLEMVEKNILQGIEQGLYRDDIDAKIIAKLRIEEVEMAMNPAVYPPDKFNLTTVQMALLDHFLHGITTLKGHKLINKYKQVIEEE